METTPCRHCLGSGPDPVKLADLGNVAWPQMEVDEHRRYRRCQGKVSHVTPESANAITIVTMSSCYICLCLFTVLV